MGAVIVKPDELGALEFMGKFQRILKPGLQILFPGYAVRKISSRVVQNTCITETKTKDNVFVRIHIAVQQEVLPEKAFEAFYRLTNPQNQIDSFVSDVVRSHAPNETLDDLFAEKEKIAQDVKARLSEAMAAYGYLIHEVLVVDIAPDETVKRAMNEINAASRLRQAAQNNAEADKVVLVKAAEAEAESKFLAGQGTARSRAAIVEGLREAVCNKDRGEELSSKDVTQLLLMTQYLDTLEKISAGPAKTVFIPSGSEGMAGIAQQIRDGIMQADASK